MDKTSQKDTEQKNENLEGNSHSVLLFIYICFFANALFNVYKFIFFTLIRISVDSRLRMPQQLNYHAVRYSFLVQVVKLV